ncbi:hypothetical protein C1645_743846 [Glomus cerebriforme]|uniref:HTH myb-type domain-containing protein n=1 Tax=Glomus cerebriforme TaxID=658196 RepID=A0A397SEB3_9GLOM|nr:hypothetical protein C1645_743846 [Glomus cerebriforme]
MPLFDENSNKVIMRSMKKWKNRYNRFVKISKLIPNYTPKQIASHWKNHLDPNLCRDSLNEDEKKFVAEWLQKNQTSNGLIPWKKVANDLNNRFGKKHAGNKIKNYWNARKKSHLRKAKTEELKQRCRIVEQQYRNIRFKEQDKGKGKIRSEEEQGQEKGKSIPEKQQGKSMTEGQERKFFFKFVSSDPFILPKNQNEYSKITISSLLNFDNNL